MPIWHTTYNWKIAYVFSEFLIVQWSTLVPNQFLPPELLLLSTDPIKLRRGCRGFLLLVVNIFVCYEVRWESHSRVGDRHVSKVKQGDEAYLFNKNSMDSFSSSSMPPPGAKLESAQRDQLMDQVKAQIAVANAQELLQVRTVSDKKGSCCNHVFQSTAPSDCSVFTNGNKEFYMICGDHSGGGHLAK